MAQAPVKKADPKATAKYKVASPIKLVDGIAEIGDEIELTAREAAELRAFGAIEGAAPESAE
jgi:hypothetical protein